MAEAAPVDAAAVPAAPAAPSTTAGPAGAAAGPGTAVVSGEDPGGVAAVGGSGGSEAGVAGAPSAQTAGDESPAARAPSAQEIAALRRRIDARKVYPQIAIRNGWEGRVLVEMHLDLDGRLAAVRLVAGSGYSILDEATITAVRLASPFPPVARVVTVPVEYRLIP
jgi:protein TonB